MHPCNLFWSEVPNPWGDLVTKVKPLAGCAGILDTFWFFSCTYYNGYSYKKLLFTTIKAFQQTLYRPVYLWWYCWKIERLIMVLRLWRRILLLSKLRSVILFSLCHIRSVAIKNSFPLVITFRLWILWNCLRILTIIRVIREYPETNLRWCSYRRLPVPDVSIQSWHNTTLNLII